MRVLRPRLLAGLALAALLRPEGARGAGAPIELSLYAAASLRDVMQALAPACERATGTRLVFNFGASNDLARQIEAAAKADLFLSADELSMDRVAKSGLLDAPSRRTLVSNRLVVVGPADSPLRIASPSDLSAGEIRHLALATPGAVPAGTYAKAWLEKAGAWPAVRGRVVPAVDVRAALALVESGAAEAGVVYRTDAAISKKVRVLYEVPESDEPRIAYVAAAISGRPHLEIARGVLAWLAAPEATATFVRFGFTVPPHRAARPEAEAAERAPERGAP